MPEIIEVYFTAAYLNKYLHGANITSIEILGGRYLTHKNTLTNFTNFKNNLPLKINKIGSKGKFLWFDLSNNDSTYYILNTFGLTGSWGFKKIEHSNVLFTLKKNNKIITLYFNDPRNFGSIILTPLKNILDKKLNSLGPDLLQEPFTEEEFYERIKVLTSKNTNKKKEIVKILMDQTKSGLGCGIGNYLSAEILFHAKISPHTKLEVFIENKILSNRLSKSIKYVIKLAFLTSDIGYMEKFDPKINKYIENVRNSVDATNIFHQNMQNIGIGIGIGNKKFTFNVYGKSTDPNGNKVVADEIIAKRKTYWSPKIQILYQ